MNVNSVISTTELALRVITMRSRKDKKRRSKLRDCQRQEKTSCSNPFIKEDEASTSETETVEETFNDFSDYAYNSYYFDNHWPWDADSERNYEELDSNSDWEYPESNYDHDYIPILNAESNKSYKMLRIPAIVSLSPAH